MLYSRLLSARESLRLLRRESWPALAMLGLHLSLLAIITRLTGAQLQGGWLAGTREVFLSMGTVLLSVVALGRLLWLLCKPPARGLVPHLADELRATLFNPLRVTIFFVTMTSLCLIGAAFLEAKIQMSLLAPFSWDMRFAAIDRALFFGHTPADLLAPLLGLPWLTTAINVVYHLWLPVLLIAQFAVSALPAGDGRRPQFVLAFGLVWAVGGIAMAYAFSSAGPVYVQRLGLGDEFARHMARLAELDRLAPVWALGLQEMLWQGHLGNGPAYGISAFPSMHNAGAALFTALAFSFSRPLGWGMVAFTLLVLLGSIHLGWHYAVDGFAGLALGVAGWKAAGWLLAYPKISWQNSSASQSASTSARVL